jgi:type IV fimbrial biogenesis protein FimT
MKQDKIIIRRGLSLFTDKAKRSRRIGTVPVYSNADGLSLVEMLIVIAIAGILIAIATIQFGQWNRKYNIEREIKELYSDLMNARSLAMNRNRFHFVSLAANQYTIRDDSNDNGVNESADALVLQKNTINSIVWNGTGSNINFDKKGFARNERTICIFSNVSPGYDCIVVSETRINMGRIQNQGGACATDNCQQR